MLPILSIPPVRKFAFPFLLVLLLTACGGGGGGGPDSDPPTALSSTFTAFENTPGTGTFNVTVSNGRTPTFTILQNGTRGTAVVSNQAAGEFTYTPNPDVTGSDAFSFKVNDGTADSNVAVVTVSILRAVPTAVGDAVITLEDLPVTIDVLANDTGNGHALAPATVALASMPVKGTAAINTNGTITYTPFANVNGADSFSYTVRDDVGGRSNAASVAITVTPVNDPPLPANDSFAVAEDSTTSLAVLANNGHGIDSDVDGDPLVITAVGTANQGGSFTINSAQNGLVYIPAANFSGTETVSYTVSDGQGGTGSATVTVLVTPVNDNPVAEDDDITVAEDSTTTLLVLTNNGHGADYDVDNGTLTIVGVSLTSQGGSLSLNAGRTALIYTPTPNFFGIETFTYTLGDDQGGSDTATVTVAVTSVNDPPLAQDDELTVSEDSTSTLQVLSDNGHGSDSDIEGDALTIIAVGPGSQGGSISINGAGNAVIYTPAQNFTGTETFTYTVGDGNGGSDDGTVTMTITPVNDAPVARNDMITVAINSNNNLLTVLADNGNGPDSDADLDVMTIVSVGTPDQGGNVSINGAQNALIYTPPPGLIGTESFTYTISDGQGGGDTATVFANSAFIDNFSGGSGNWTLVNDTGATSSWAIAGGALQQQNRAAGALDQSYHRGTYAYYTAGTAFSNYRFTVNALPLDVSLADDIGVMFRYQDNNNYYRLTMNSRYGFTRLEKKVAGVFSTLAINGFGYGNGQLLTFTVDANGSRILIYIDDEPVFAVNDTSLTTGSVALYTQIKASFDNVAVNGASLEPAVILASPIAASVRTGSSISASAVANNVPAGGGIEFLLDGTVSQFDVTQPYSASFSSVAQGDHIVEAVLRDASNLELSRDTNTLVGAQGDYYLAIGDSITNGDIDNYATDNESGSRILSFQGYAANLAEYLESSEGIPVMVYNEGIGGDESMDTAFSRINSILSRHPNSNKALILLGTNDALSGSVPSGSGCSGSGCNGKFKGNMQSLINTLNSAGKTVYIARVLPVFGITSPFANPSTASVNVNYVQPYNSVIANELTGRQLGPDLYDYFLGSSNRFSLYSDGFHPNALGHVVMAGLWHNVLNPGNPIGLPFVLENLTRSTTSPYLKQNLLEVGDLYYVDRTLTLSSIPPILDGGRWIMTANADAGSTSSNYVAFDVDRDVTVYIAYDGGATSLPNWMSAYVDTGLSVATTDLLSPSLKLYSRTFGSGSTVTLGGNLAAGASGANSNYVAIVVPN